MYEMEFNFMKIHNMFSSGTLFFAMIYVQVIFNRYCYVNSVVYHSYPYQSHLLHILRVTLFHYRTWQKRAMVITLSDVDESIDDITNDK